MFLLVIFAVAIYLIMQIPEVKDYIVPPSGQFGGIPTTSNLNSSNRCSNGASNYPICSNALICSNGASNYPICSNAPIYPRCSNGASNYPICSNAPIYMTCSNGATDYPTCSNVPRCSNGATDYPTCSNIITILSGTPISGNLTTDATLTFNTLKYNLFYDRSVTESQSNVYFTDENSKLNFLTYSNYEGLIYRINSGVQNSNYRTIEEVVDNTKNFVYSNIPNINTYQIINLNNLIFDAARQDAGFYTLVITSMFSSNSETNFNNLVYFKTYSANWYVAHSNLASNILTSNYINVATSYLLDYFGSNSNAP